MIIKFHTKVPFKERLKILWHGVVFVSANYKGQCKPMHIELGAVNPKELEK